MFHIIKPFFKQLKRKWKDADCYSLGIVAKCIVQYFCQHKQKLAPNLPKFLIGLPEERKHNEQWKMYA
jgi:hypothetical protein